MSQAARAASAVEEQPERPLFRPDGTVDPPALAVIVRDLEVALRGIQDEVRAGLAARRAYHASMEALVEATAGLLGCVRGLLDSRVGQSVLVLVGLSFAAACLQVAGMPMEPLFDYALGRGRAGIVPGQ